jgi:hypothetical protein
MTIEEKVKDAIERCSKNRFLNLNSEFSKIPEGVIYGRKVKGILGEGSYEYSEKSKYIMKYMHNVDLEYDLETNLRETLDHLNEDDYDDD